MAHVSGYNKIYSYCQTINIYEVYAIARYDTYVEFIKKKQLNHLFS